MISDILAKTIRSSTEGAANLARKLGIPVGAQGVADGPTSRTLSTNGR